MVGFDGGGLPSGLEIASNSIAIDIKPQNAMKGYRTKMFFFVSPRLAGKVAAFQQDFWLGTAGGETGKSLHAYLAPIFDPSPAPCCVKLPRSVKKHLGAVIEIEKSLKILGKTLVFFGSVYYTRSSYSVN
jgi:hypothetical protein